MKELPLLTPANSAQMHSLGEIQCSGQVGALCWSPSHQDLLAIAVDDAIFLYAMTDLRRPIHCLRGHTDVIFDIAFSPNGQLLASGSDDMTVRLWDTHAAMGYATLSAKTHISSVSFRADGAAVAAAENWDASILVWNLQPQAPVLRSVELPGNILVVAYTPDDRSLIAGCGDGSIVVWDSTTNTTRILLGHRASVWDLTLLQDGLTLVSASADGTIKLWNWKTGKQHGSFVSAEPARSYSAIAKNAGTTLVASGDLNGSVHLWDSTTGRELRHLAEHRGALLALDFNKQGTLLACGDSGGLIQLWGIS